MYEIYTKPTCVFCTRAKDLLSLLGEDYTEYNIENSELFEQLIQKLGYRPKTVPQIFHDGKLIGGYTELVEFTK